MYPAINTYNFSPCFHTHPDSTAHCKQNVDAGSHVLTSGIQKNKAGAAYATLDSALCKERRFLPWQTGQTRPVVCTIPINSRVLPCWTQYPSFPARVHTLQTKSQNSPSHENNPVNMCTRRTLPMHRKKLAKHSLQISYLATGFSTLLDLLQITC